MKIFRYILPAMLIVFCLFCSCSLGVSAPEEFEAEEEMLQEEAEDPDTILDNSDETPPTADFLYCQVQVLSETEIVFEFSQPVTAASLNFSPELEFEMIVEGSAVKVNLADNPEPGLLVEAELSAEDEYGNIINEQIEFRTRNNRVPALQINELFTDYDSKKLKAEYIEFKILSDGNLGALRVFAASNNKNPLIYQFEPVEVNEGDYIVLHLRKLQEELCKDEYGDRLDESDGVFSCPTARDFWIPGSTKLLRRTDAVYVLDQDDNALDAVMIAENSNSWLNKNYFPETAEFLFNKGVWKSSLGTVCGVADAVNISEITNTKSVSRDDSTENTNTAADWYVTATKGTTPGLPNNP
jgi:hypothetical protein